MGRGGNLLKITVKYSVKAGDVPKSQGLTSKLMYICGTYMEVLCLEERNDNFWDIRGMRYLSNNNLIVYKETGKNLIKIYVS